MRRVSRCAEAVCSSKDNTVVLTAGKVFHLAAQHIYITVMRAGIWYHMNQFYNDHDLSVAFVWVTTASMLTQARCYHAFLRA